MTAATPLICHDCWDKKPNHRDACPHTMGLVDHFHKQLKGLQLQIGEKDRQMSGAVEEMRKLNLVVGNEGRRADALELRLNAIETELTASHQLNSVYRKALEEIANDKEGPFYPDGGYMAENTCAKIALGLSCPLCGSPLPCTYHEKKAAEKRLCSSPKAVPGDNLAVELCGEEYVGGNCPKCGKHDVR